ncbi:hypothetical protein ES332_A05G367100v1 [Gossypium tomentosum]|uniref:Uncharacterized protein n=1 Tax=Gossypium tomentosum TaxID=34277 RepID=A0A5D2QP04_GOSTO|nr:hypothetical protein ES332_A05G367100v1 [Gossypium tomentosum]
MSISDNIFSSCLGDISTPLCDNPLATPIRNASSSSSPIFFSCSGVSFMSAASPTEIESTKANENTTKEMFIFFSKSKVK